MMESEKFEREAKAFEHNAAQMRALNEQMNKVPTISVSLTGGLWFAAAQVPTIDIAIKFGLLVFAGVANIGLALSCFRIRDVMQSYLEKIEEFSPGSFVRGQPKKPVLKGLSSYSMISIYAGLMAIAAVLSFAGAILFYWPFSPSERGIAVFVIVLTLLTIMLGLFCGRSKSSKRS